MLYKRFRRLDRGGRGTISLDDLTMIPEIAMNPLSPRLAVLFERDAEDRINFKSFVTALATFSDKSDPEAKCRGAVRRRHWEGVSCVLSWWWRSADAAVAWRRGTAW